MALITVDDDLRPALGTGYTLTETSHPSVDDVAVFIDEIEAEVRALWSGTGGTWPEAGTPEALYPKLTIVLGVTWAYLSAKFSSASAGSVPDALMQARLAYNDRLNRIPSIVAGSEQAEPATETSTRPRVGVGGVPLDDGATFGEWSQLRDFALRRRWLVGRW